MPTCSMALPMMSQLQSYALLCSGEKTLDDYKARVAAFTLKSIPIRWYRKVRTTNQATAHEIANDLLLLSSGVPTHSFSSSSTAYVGFQASLSIVDTKEGLGIQIVGDDKEQDRYEFIQDDDGGDDSARLDSSFDTNDNKEQLFHSMQYFEGLSKHNRSEQKMHSTRTILLKVIDEVKIGNDLGNIVGSIGGNTGRCICDVKVYGLEGRRDPMNLFGSGKKILQFDLASKDQDKEEYSEDVIGRLNSAVEWDRRRRGISHSIHCKLADPIMDTCCRMATAAVAVDE